MPSSEPNSPPTTAPSAKQTEARNPARVTAPVTAIVPARNEEAVIAACVESLAGQPEAEGELRRLDEDRHLVAIVLAAVMEPVNGRADRSAKDRARLHDLALLVAAHRRRVARWL